MAVSSRAGPPATPVAINSRGDGDAVMGDVSAEGAILAGNDMGRPGLARDELRELSAPDPWRWGVELAAFWLAIFALVEAAVLVSWTLWLVPISLLIGCLQNGLILWTHEGAHINLVRDRRRNDHLADLLISGPIGVYIASYRWHHGRHHRYLGDGREEIELSAYYPIQGALLWRHVARHLFGSVALSIIFRSQGPKAQRFGAPPPRSRAAWLGLGLVNAALFTLCAAQGEWMIYAVVWGFPLVTIAPMISNFRTIVEHQPLGSVPGPELATTLPPFTRIVDAGLLERVLIAPIGFHYHYEHHLYPAIPYHRLGEVRRRLQAIGHYDAPGLVTSKGYLRTVVQLATTRSRNMPVTESAS